MKVIDCHGHVTAPEKLWLYQAALISHKGAHGKGKLSYTDEEIIEAVSSGGIAEEGHLHTLDSHGIDMQIISPRPFRSMHSEKPAKIVHWWIEKVNDAIARVCEALPDRFIPVGGLPQAAGDPVETYLAEIDRCVKNYGFKGFILNPDPFENGSEKAPPMGDRYWYPLYEKLCEHDVVAHIHPTGSRHPDREPYTLHFINEQTTAVYGLARSSVFEDFPTLKILSAHGGGAIPYQMERFSAQSVRNPKPGVFSEWMLNMYYDSVLYSQDALELLIKTVGPERVLYGSECPGVGTPINPKTGRSYDDIRPSVEAIEWLSLDDKEKIFFHNANALFNLGLEP